MYLGASDGESTTIFSQVFAKSITPYYIKCGNLHEKIGLKIDTYAKISKRAKSFYSASPLATGMSQMPLS